MTAVPGLRGTMRPERRSADVMVLHRRLPVVAQPDVLVVGGGCAGTAAAIDASHECVPRRQRPIQDRLPARVVSTIQARRLSRAQRRYRAGCGLGAGVTACFSSPGSAPIVMRRSMPSARVIRMTVANDGLPSVDSAL